MEKIGLQLYSLRMDTAKDLLGTMRKVAEIGYDGVEFAGYFGVPAKELKTALDDFGMKPAGSHIGIDQLTSRLDAVIDFSLELGEPYIICPGLPHEMTDSMEACLNTAELFNRIGEKCNANGLQFYYHNHYHEFEKRNGEFILDILMANTEEDNLHAELDTYWVEYAGLKSVDFMKKYGNRCSILHIKDMLDHTNKNCVTIGQGVLDFKEITALGKELGVRWYTVEQEEFAGNPYEDLEQGLKYLRGILK